MTTTTEALRLISDTNTTMYSFGFSSTRSAVAHEASKLNNSQPGPAHGCFSKEGADAEYEGHYSKQVLDCISQLAPPLRLATMAFLATRNSLRTNTAESSRAAYRRRVLFSLPTMQKGSEVRSPSPTSLTMCPTSMC